jgi:hypothetical protein
MRLSMASLPVLLGGCQQHTHMVYGESLTWKLCATTRTPLTLDLDQCQPQLAGAHRRHCHCCQHSLLGQPHNHLVLVDGQDGVLQEQQQQQQ